MNENEELMEGQQTEAQETGAEQQKPRGMAAMRGRYNDLDPDASDDDVADRFSQDYDALNDRVKKHDEADAQMEKLFSENQQSANFLRGMARGEDFLSNLYKNFGEDIVAAMQDPEKLEELKAANQEYLDKVAKNKELAAEWDKNFDESFDRIEQAKQELGMTDEEVANGMDMWKKAVDAWCSGNIDMETIKMFLSAANHDSDVESARREGEINGRNAKINEGMRKRSTESDGVASLGGQSRASSEGRTITNKNQRRGGVGSGIWGAGGGMKYNNYD